MTGPRREIISVLEAADEYMSAEEVYMEVYRRQPGIGIATVYRTLQLLTEIGTAQRVDTGDGKARYKLSPEEERKRRIVLICSHCSRTVPVTEISEDDQRRIAEVEASMHKQHGFSTERSVTQFFGQCAECAGTMNNPNTNNGGG
jgi:Fur family ferric uptake transcriptional regulator